MVLAAEDLIVEIIIEMVGETISIERGIIPTIRFQIVSFRGSCQTWKIHNMDD